MDNQKKLKKDNQIIATIKFDKDLIFECDKNIEKANCRSRTEYIENALSFYNHYLDSGDQVGYLTPILSTIVDTSIKSFEEHISRNIFKIAVELAKVLNVFAAVHDIDDSTLKELQIKCVDEVRKINGILDFNDAVKYQKS